MVGQGFVDLKVIQKSMHDVPKSDFPTRIGKFRLFGLEGVELRQWRKHLNDNDGSDYNDVAIMLWGCRDKNGKRYLDKEALLQLVCLGADITVPVVREIYNLSGLGDEADSEIVKNLESRITDLESEFAVIIDAAKKSLNENSTATS